MAPEQQLAQLSPRSRSHAAPFKLVTVASSAGGLHVPSTVFENLPPTFAVPILRGKKLRIRVRRTPLLGDKKSTTKGAIMFMEEAEFEQDRAKAKSTKTR